MFIAYNAWRRRQQLSSARILFAGSMLVLVACGEPDSRFDGGPAAQSDPASSPLLITPAPTPDKDDSPLQDDPLPEPGPEEPINVDLEVALAPSSSPKELVANSDHIVTGTVVEILPPMWTTSDGERPSNPWSVGVVPDRFTIVTPVVLELDGILSLSSADATLEDQTVIIAAHGGQIGADNVRSNAPWDQYDIGEHVLVALADEYTNIPTIDSPFVTDERSVWRPIAKYNLTDDGLAVTYDSEQPTAALVAALIDAAAAP